MTIWNKLRMMSISDLFTWLKGRVWHTQVMLLLRRPAGKPPDGGREKPCRGTVRTATEAELGDCGDFENAARSLPFYRSLLERGSLIRLGYLDGRCVYRSSVQRSGTVPFSGHTALTLGPKEMYVCHVYCAPDARGNGLQKEDLRRLCEEYPDVTFYAFVKQDNIPSLRSFYRAGYEPCALVSGKQRFFLYYGFNKKILTLEEAETYRRQAESAPRPSGNPHA